MGGLSGDAGTWGIPPGQQAAQGGGGVLRREAGDVRKGAAFRQQLSDQLPSGKVALPLQPGGASPQGEAPEGLRGALRELREDAAKDGRPPGAAGFQPAGAALKAGGVRLAGDDGLAQAGGEALRQEELRHGLAPPEGAAGDRGVNQVCQLVNQSDGVQSGLHRQADGGAAILGGGGEGVALKAAHEEKERYGETLAAVQGGPDLREIPRRRIGVRGKCLKGRDGLGVAIPGALQQGLGQAGPLFPGRDGGEAVVLLPEGPALLRLGGGGQAVECQEAGHKVPYRDLILLHGASFAETFLGFSGYRFRIPQGFPSRNPLGRKSGPGKPGFPGRFS